MSFFEKLKQGMTKTRKNIAEKLSGVFSMFTRVDEDLLEELEETLILCDVGVNTATRVIGMAGSAARTASCIASAVAPIRMAALTFSAATGPSGA